LRDAVLDSLAGIGTGSLREHFDEIRAGDVKFYLSGGSCQSCGLDAEQLRDKPAKMGNLSVLIGLALNADTMFTYLIFITVYGGITMTKSIKCGDLFPGCEFYVRPKPTTNCCKRPPRMPHRFTTSPN